VIVGCAIFVGLGVLSRGIAVLLVVLVLARLYGWQHRHHNHLQ